MTLIILTAVHQCSNICPRFYFCQRGEIVGDIYCHNLRKNCDACFSHLIEGIKGCNMSCLKVGALVGRPSWMARLTIIKKIQF